MAAQAAELDGTIADLAVGDYVSFAEKGKQNWSAGTVAQISKTFCYVKSMTRSTGSAFVWPTVVGDEKVPERVDCQDILSFLEPPQFSRRYWVFPAESIGASDEAYLQWRQENK